MQRWRRLVLWRRTVPWRSAREQCQLIFGRQRGAGVNGVDIFLFESSFKTVAALSSPRVLGIPEARHGEDKLIGGKEPQFASAFRRID